MAGWRVHTPVADVLPAERTSYRSQLIPVTPYIFVVCSEAFYRCPHMVRAIDAALRAEQTARAGRRDLPDPAYRFLAALDGDLVGLDPAGVDYYAPLA